MEQRLFAAINDCESMHDVLDIVKRLLKETKNGGHDRIGYVAGIISSDGPEHIAANFARLCQYSRAIRVRAEIPLISAGWVFPPDMFNRLNGAAMGEQFFYDFWEQVLRTGHITDMFFTPRWEVSNA